MSARDRPERRAEDHLSDLNMAAAIQTLCESSLFRSRVGKAFEQRIAKLCRDEGQRQLRLLDKARAEI
ncbi:hypothetical protein [Sphingobium baderi]|uniref:Uncharacterized protein n=1 Tax=Sphingobium baderi LL03 TaxID=1114964 RepID=T0HH61_9SPHN|nr:hypothetical protein [Sphingobium baderi]EQA96878.1 hypothetical protein L485_22625 [Sphingobium baderi LL03]KMS64115.1 hypothetical protein V475_20175 [Sphingobium baderi LL03]